MVLQIYPKPTKKPKPQTPEPLTLNPKPVNPVTMNPSNPKPVTVMMLKRRNTVWEVSDL